jgi:hypothetical protein
MTVAAVLGVTAMMDLLQACFLYQILTGKLSSWEIYRS